MSAEDLAPCPFCATQQRDALVGALEEAEGVLALVEQPRWEDPLYGDEVRALGDRIGFGALMSSAQASWARRAREQGYPAGGEFVAGPCFATVQHTLKLIRQALSTIKESK